MLLTISETMNLGKKRPIKDQFYPKKRPKRDQFYTHFTEKETYLASRFISTHSIKTDRGERRGKVVPERPNICTDKCVYYHIFSH